MGVFQPFPLQLFHFVFTFDYRQESGRQPSQTVRSTSASRLNLSIFPHPPFHVFPFKTGVVWLLAFSPGRRQNWLQIQLGMGWFHPAGQSNNPRQKSKARPRSTPWGAPGWEPRHKELELAKEFRVSLLASLDGYSARESFLGSPRCVLERNLGHASGSSCLPQQKSPSRELGMWHSDTETCLLSRLLNIFSSKACLLWRPLHQDCLTQLETLQVNKVLKY